jgi:hypothetical protein
MNSRFEESWWRADRPTLAYTVSAKPSKTVRPGQRLHGRVAVALSDDRGTAARIEVLVHGEEMGDLPRELGRRVVERCEMISTHLKTAASGFLIALPFEDHGA